MVGAFRRLQHVVCGGKKHRTNVSLEAHPEAGPNDNFLRLVARSPNKAGIAMDTPLVANFGPLFDPTKEVPFSLDATPVKRFKSALDLLFESQQERMNQEEEIGGEPQKKEEDNKEGKKGEENEEGAQARVVPHAWPSLLELVLHESQERRYAPSGNRQYS